MVHVTHRCALTYAEAVLNLRSRRGAGHSSALYYEAAPCGDRSASQAKGAATLRSASG